MPIYILLISILGHYRPTSKMRKLPNAIIVIFALISILFSSITLNAQNCNMFIVSFISIGAGIDRNMQKEFKSFLHEKYPHLSYEVSPAGYEGEGDYCFDLSDLSEEQQVAFREESIELLAKSRLVKILEQENCPNKLR